MDNNTKMTPEDDKNALAHKAVGLIIDTNRMHKKISDRSAFYARMHGSQHRILMYIASQKGFLTQKMIADHFEISAAAIAVTMRKLESADYIFRDKEGCPDTRYNRIVITEKGEYEVKRASAYFDMIDGKMFNNFDESEISEFIRLLDKAKDNLSELVDADDSEVF